MAIASRLTITCVATCLVLGAASSSQAVLVNYEVQNGFQQAWAGTFDVSSLASAIGTTSTSSPSVSTITGQESSTSLSFVATDYLLSVNNSTVQWGGNSGNSGFIMWSPDFYAYVTGGGTWQNAIGNSYALSYASYFQDQVTPGNSFATDGGFLVFPVPEPSTLLLGALALPAVAFGRRAVQSRR